MIADEQEIPIAESTEEFEEPVFVPKRIGSCSNAIKNVYVDGKPIPVPCGRFIDDQDLEALELPPEGNRRKFICGSCVENLLSLSLGPADPEKNARARIVRGKYGVHGKQQPRLSKG